MRKTPLLLVAIAGVGSLLSCASDSSQIRHNKYLHKIPAKTTCYQAQEHGQTVGYAHKYQWETASGNDHFYHLIYGLDKNLVGYVGSDGYTEKYTSDGQTKPLGNYTLEGALPRIFDTEGDVQLYTVATEDVPVKAIPKMPVAQKNEAVPATKTEQPETTDDSQLPTEEKSE